MELPPGVRRRGRVTLIRCAVMGGGFANLAKVIDGLRDDGETRVVVLQTRAMAAPDWRADEAPVLADAVLPVVAAWSDEQSPEGIAAGLFADIRTGDESLGFDGLDTLDGPVRARLELLLGGKTAAEEGLTWSRAYDAGLVTVIQPGSGALAAAMRIAEAIAERGPIATQLAKEAIWRGLAMPLEQALRFETDLTLLLQSTKDRAEGVRAFIEKRPPQFEGV